MLYPCCVAVISEHIESQKLWGQNQAKFKYEVPEDLLVSLTEKVGSLG